ncbi:MAG: hypothetical protein HY920_08145 [Elusimicrobia bacterium]|nr:hypothetical protein [Elusimicrobiota bacterium]
MKKILAALLVVSLTLGCTYALKVTNEGDFEPETTTLKQQVKLGVLNTNDDLLSSVVNKLQMDPNIAEIKFNYQPNSGVEVDYAQKLERKAKYRADGQNFIITFPGFILFAHAWAGYKYYIDIATISTLLDKDGKVLKNATFNTTYEIRYTSFARGATTSLCGWILPPYGGLDIIAGAFFAGTFDHRGTDEFYDKVKDSYSSYIASKIVRQIKKQEDKEAPKESEFQTVPVVIAMDNSGKKYDERDFGIDVWKIENSQLEPVENKLVRLSPDMYNRLYALDTKGQNLQPEDYREIITSFQLANVPTALNYQDIHVYSLRGDRVVDLLKDRKSFLAKK